VLKGIENYDPVESAVEVFKIAKKYAKEKEDFMNLDGEEILDLIIRKNKVGEILQLMEEEKREVIKAYRDIRTIK
jgi:hypothetical protein